MAKIEQNGGNVVLFPGQKGNLFGRGFDSIPPRFMNRQPDPNRLRTEENITALSFPKPPKSDPRLPRIDRRP